MKTLTAKEEEIMGFFWEKGPMFVKQLVELYEEPRPHFNTLSTIVRGLEEKGYLSHTAFGNTYQYHAVVSEEEFRRKTLHIPADTRSAFPVISVQSPVSIQCCWQS